jgi:hypothetical protein
LPSVVPVATKNPFVKLNQQPKKQKTNMKKTLLLALALGVASASPIKAFDLYLTGSTAFRANVYDACLKLYDTTPTLSGGIVVGDSTTGGNAPQSPTDKNYQWTMTGTVSNTIPFMGPNVLTIHALFNGSIQGIKAVENLTPLPFLRTDGTVTNNPATIAFSDTASAASPYNVSGFSSFLVEQKVAVQPFVFVKSVAGGGLTNVNNLTSEQLKSLLPIGNMPLSAWSQKASDTNTFVYMINRTLDSGSRLSAVREVNNIYGSSVTIYNYDFTNNLFFNPTVLAVNTVGSTNFGVVGPTGGAGLPNTNWGFGYVGGGDIATELQYTNPANQAIAYLSFSDAKKIVPQGGSQVNWSQVISFNGNWPTALGSAIAGNSGTNDFSPITLGQYPFWNYEVLIGPKAGVDPSSVSGWNQNLTAAQYGTQATAGTIIGVLNHQVFLSGGSPVVGSIENEIELSKVPAAGPATAIRLSDMKAGRGSVGGTITP